MLGIAVVAFVLHDSRRVVVVAVVVVLIDFAVLTVAALLCRITILAVRRGGALMGGGGGGGGGRGGGGGAAVLVLVEEEGVLEEGRTLEERSDEKADRGQEPYGRDGQDPTPQPGPHRLQVPTGCLQSVGAASQLCCKPISRLVITITATIHGPDTRYTIHSNGAG